MDDDALVDAMLDAFAKAPVPVDADKLDPRAWRRSGMRAALELAKVELAKRDSPVS